MFWKVKIIASEFNMVTNNSVAQSCPTLWDPVDCSTPGFPVHHQLSELAQLMSIESVMSSNHLILLLPFPSALNLSRVRVFSNDLGLFQ